MDIKYQVAQIDKEGKLTMLPDLYNEYKEAQDAITFDLPQGSYQVQKIFIKL